MCVPMMVKLGELHRSWKSNSDDTFEYVIESPPDGKPSRNGGTPSAIAIRNTSDGNPVSGMSSSGRVTMNTGKCQR